MDWVVPVRPGRDNEELRYALRSVRANVAGLGRIVIVGYKPPWLGGVVHIPVRQNPRRRFRNVVANLLAACQAPISDRFVYANDDEFVMAPIPITGFPLTHAGSLADHIGRLDAGGRNAAWSMRLSSTLALLTDRGHPDPLSYALHVPMTVDRIDLLRVLRDLGDLAVGRDLITCYAALTGRTGVPGRDRKVTTGRVPPPWPILSTSDDSFRRYPVGHAIRARFPQPATGEAPPQYIYERDGHRIARYSRSKRLDRLAGWTRVPSGL